MHVTNSKAAIVLALFLVSGAIFASDARIEGARLLRAEKMLTYNYAEGVRLLLTISDSTFKGKEFFKFHNHNCIANFYYLKTNASVESGEYEEAQRVFLCFMKHHMLADDSKNLLVSASDSMLDKELLFLKTLQQAEKNDRATADLLKSQLECFKPCLNLHHFTLTTLTTEYKLLHHTLYWPLVLLTVTTILFTFYWQRKKEEICFITDCHSKEEERLKKCIASLESNVDSDIRKINSLSVQLEHLQQANMQRIGIGKQFYDEVKSGGTMKNISVYDEQCFIDYYAYIFPQRYHELTLPYSSLTLRHTTFLVLSEMGFSDKDICRILFVKDSTIRNYRMRMNKKKTDLQSVAL